MPSCKYVLSPSFPAFRVALSHMVAKYNKHKKLDMID